MCRLGFDPRYFGGTNALIRFDRFDKIKKTQKPGIRVDPKAHLCKKIAITNGNQLNLAQVRQTSEETKQNK